MKLIFITQKLAYNDPLMGFTHSWVNAFSKQVDQLVVITNELGEVKLDPRIKIYSLGKEKGHGRLKKFYLLNQILRKEKNADAIFCHQCPIYILSLIPSNLTKKIPFYLWYAHGHLSKSAAIATFFSKKVFTSSPYALNLNSPKKRVLGQGVNMASWENDEKTFDSTCIRMVHVGRISEVKNILPMILLARDLTLKGRKVSLSLIGDPAVSKDKDYFSHLQNVVKENNLSSSVHFLGGMTHEQIIKTLKDCDFTLNFSTSAAIDKSLIETTAAGLFPISYNASFLHTIQETELYDLYQEYCVSLNLLEYFFNLPAVEKKTLQRKFFEIMKQKHNLDNLVTKILQEIRL